MSKMPHTQTSLEIGNLMGGGLVLGYRCSSRCQHCLYGSGPHRADGSCKDRKSFDFIMEQLAIRAPHAHFHIGGGEPFLDPDLLERAIIGFHDYGLTLDYVETNASWAQNDEKVENLMNRMAKAGLESLFVSLSPFHAEFIPLERTLRVIDGAQRILPRGAFVWIPEFLSDLSGYSRAKKLNLNAHISIQGDYYAQDLAFRYSLIPAGRAGRFLYNHGVRHPWKDLLQSEECSRRLRDTSHFHVDLQGLFVPGLCPGIVLSIEDVPGKVDLSSYPILRALVQGGTRALYEFASKEGFEPLDSYSSPCDFCTHMRQFLLNQHDYAELGPPGYYDSRSVKY